MDILFRKHCSFGPKLLKMKPINFILGIALAVPQGAMAMAVHGTQNAGVEAHVPRTGALPPRSRHLSPEDRAAIASSPDLTFQFPKNGTFELIQSLTEIVAFEAREAEKNPPPDDGTAPPPGTPPKKKEPYKCGCHCTILICGCTCKSLPLPALPPQAHGLD